ncbi:primosomal protein N' [Marinicella sp. W31]|uniref:primosomal protein N' n=1 Tax=Marinicella sp. W31 TaxID=3023713 RepID=UPI003757BA5B
MPESKQDSIIQVCLNIRFTDHLDYLCDLNTTPLIGCRVVVPFRRKQLVGIVIGHQQNQNKRQLKRISQHIDDQPILDKSQLNFLKKAAAYYQLKMGEAVFLALPHWYRQIDSKQLPMPFWWQINSEPATVEALLKKAPAQWLVYSKIAELGPVQTSELKKFNTNAAALCKQLAEKQLIKKIEQPPPHETITTGFELTEDQQNAYEFLKTHDHSFSIHLLDGITGSGKTEVYIRCIENLLIQKKQVLVLVPEIGLTPQLYEQLHRRINARIGVSHSALSHGQRALMWKQTAEGDLDVLVATRSGIFNRFSNLGMIIIDEEHDLSFRQQEGIRYSARDLAVLRASMMNIPVILGSATPSLESLNNALQKRYHWLKLRTRTNQQQLPKIIIKDIRKKRVNGGLSSEVIDQIDTHLSAQQQVLVFINRRGWSPKMVCQDCGWVAECDHCDAYLTWHKQVERLRCHHCQSVYSLPEFCPLCGCQHVIPLGDGTEKITDTLNSAIGPERVLRVDRDTIKTPKHWAIAMNEIASGKPRVIVGTQMLAKGHHFPKLSLVVIVDIDSSFFSGEFRATEHLAQLLVQVAGRAGRAETEGEVVVQTRHPDHPFFVRLLQQGYAAFAREELKQRAEQGFPPSSYMAILRAQHQQQNTLETFLLEIEKQLPQDQAVNVFGPIAAPMFIRHKHYRMQLIYNATSRQALHRLLKHTRQIISTQLNKTNVQWLLDIDPVQMN